MDTSKDKSTRGQHMAESMATWIGSWTFLIIQSVILATWVILNVLAFIKHWDPYPFILLNLFLSLQAAYTGPLLLIASNRQSEIDRGRSEQTLYLAEKILSIDEKQDHVLMHVEELIARELQKIEAAKLEGTAESK